MSMRTRLAGISAGLLLTASVTHAAHAEPLRIRYSIWVGYGRFFVAAEKGLFDKERRFGTSKPIRPRPMRSWRAA